MHYRLQSINQVLHPKLLAMAIGRVELSCLSLCKSIADVFCISAIGLDSIEL